ncbi:MAG: hypothetical protein ACRDH9_09625 [Actinomycetota bacterium]
MLAEPAFRRTFPVLVTFVLAAVLVSPVAATADDSGGTTAARALVASFRVAVSTGQLGDVLETAGIAKANAAITENPIADLSVAVSRATGLIRDAVPATGRNAEVRARALRARRMRKPAPDLLDAAGHAAVDRAAAIVASAIDSALPRLSTMRELGSAEQVAGCDIADQPPALCIAGDGQNTITEDYALVVDLGGNDTHANSAGGADSLNNGLPVSVTIDLGGNDTYSTKSPTKSGSQVAQGAAVAGAGFLVDVAGDDTYSIASEGPFSIAVGQGKALSGVGVLADLAGNDFYELDARGPGYPLAMGQGDGAHGPGVLLDLGGNDRHSIRATATEFFLLPLGGVAPPVATAQGMGTGQFGYVNFQTPPPVHVDGSYRNIGIGLFADSGGTDDLEIDATVPDPPDDTFFGPGLIGLPGAAAVGVGAAQSGGYGFAVLGDGDTETTITATTRAQYAAGLSGGLGYGYGSGWGVVSDVGGDDVRTLRSDVSVERHGHGADDCESCDTQAWGRTDIATIRGMGSTYEGGTGLLEDAEGADMYFAHATNLVDTTFADERTQGPPGKSVSLAGPVRVVAQGASESLGSAELVDAAGDDRYEVIAGSLAKAKASRQGQGPSPEATATAGESVILAQASARGTGTGSLTDLGGADTYIVSSTVGAEADPPTNTETGAATAGVLASVDETSAARFTDRDDGKTDSFTSAPATPACTGTRGQGTWVDCGGAGVGLVV